MEKMTLEMIDETFAGFKENSLITGKVVCKTKKGYLVNIGGKGDAIIYFDDCDELVAGQDVTALVVSKKDENGYVKLSVNAGKKLIEQNEAVSNLSENDEIECLITYVANNFISGKFGEYTIVIPKEQVDFLYKDNLRYYNNKKVFACIVSFNTENKKIFASIKRLRQKEKQAKEDKFWDSMYVDKIVEGEVVRIADYGAFVKVDGHDCLVHISDLSNYRVEKVEEVLKVADVKSFIVLKVDRTANRVSLGYKQLVKDERDDYFKKFKVDDVVIGKVKKVINIGVIVALNEYIDAFLHVNEAGYNIKNISRKFRENDEVKAKIIHIDSKNKKISLSINALD